jgi:hypothetical protein
MSGPRLACALVALCPAFVSSQPVAANERALAEIARYLHGAVARCWNPPVEALSEAAVRIRLEFAHDGTLAGEPIVLDPPDDPAAAALAESARRAVIRCAPYDGLTRHIALYPRWRQTVLNFHPPD